MAPSTDSVAERAEDPQEQTDDEHNDTNRPDELNPRHEADQKQQESENYHDVTLDDVRPSGPISGASSCENRRTV